MDPTRYAAAEAALWSSLGAEPTSRMLRLATIGVRVRVQELGNGPAALFVHGANTSGSSFAALAARLPGFRRIILDRPGTGLSEPLPRPLDADAMRAFAPTLVSEVLDALGLPSAHLIATSLGGYVGLRAAAVYPDRVDRMVQFSWPVGAPAARSPTMMRFMSIPGVARLVTALPPSERSVRLVFRSLGHAASLQDGRITQADLDTYLSLLRDTDTQANEMALGRSVVSPLRVIDRLQLTDDDLAAVRAPTCFVWGGRDPFGGAAAADALARRLPDARIVLLPEAGHAPWLDDLDRCAEVVERFLSDGEVQSSA